jgi:SAM-dependent methyltransferase
MRPLRYFAHPLATLSPRDLLLLEYLNLNPSMAALEVGTGSGSSLIRLAPHVASLDGVDVCSGPLERIRQAIAKYRPELSGKIRLFELNFCDQDAYAQLPQRYDLVFSCDTIEHVPDAAAFFRNIYGVLKPGGVAFLTYPNEHPRHAHGISFFQHKSTLERMLLNAGFVEGEFQIDRLTMGRFPTVVGWLGWFGPRKAMKRLARLFHSGGAAPASTPIEEHFPPNRKPQTFDETDFFAVASRYERLAPMINLYCWGLMRLMAMARPVYRIVPADEQIWDTQILIRITRTAAVPKPEKHLNIQSAGAVL